MTLSGPSGRDILVHFSTTAGTASDGLRSYQSAGPVSISGEGPGAPYPSTIVVPAAIGTVRNVAVTILGLTTSASDQLDVLLVGPQGQKLILMSDAGTSASDVTLTFDKLAPSNLPLGAPLQSGTYKTTNFYDGQADVFPPPAPAGPYQSWLGAYDGLDPVGAWSLYVVNDTLSGAPATIAGWSLTLLGDGDFVKAPMLAEFTPGSTQTTANVPVIGDLLVERDETFTIDLLSADGATIARGHAVGTILNDDVPALSVGDVTIAEPPVTTAARFTVSLDRPGLDPVTVDYATADATAVGGEDYRRPPEP